MSDEATESTRNPDGGDLLSRISNQMVGSQKRYFGKGPVQAKTYMMDDLLLTVMRGGLTTAEHTMLEFGQEDLVRNFRQQFQNEMTDRLVAMVEDLTGRRVVTYQSQVMFDPDIVVELFVFDEPVTEAAQAATAEDLAGDKDTGVVTNEAESDPPSGGGQ
jgi:uncharacterized protein YbcI